MTLFSKKDRDNYESKKYTENEYTYLNRSARSEAERVRQTLEEWFSRYPVEAQAELRRRFQSSHHHSAFFELFLHEFLIRLGCRIVKIHPPIDGMTKHPDFLVESPHGSDFYLEGVLATGESHEDNAADARINTVYDALNEMESPNFFIGMKLKGSPKTSPKAKQIRSELASWLASLDPDEITELCRLRGIEAAPRYHYKRDGWEVEFFPIPKSAEARGKAGVRPIGLQLHEMHILNTTEAIKNAVTTKATLYGELDLPYIIAVNALCEKSVDHDDAMDALFGKEQYTVSMTESGEIESGELTRNLDGAWISLSGPINTRVSAVLLADRVLPWRIPQASVYLYHNPYAKIPYKSDELDNLPQYVPRGQYMELQDRESLMTVLGLSSGWPSE